jgi:lactoylglutathione lyase
MELKLIVIRTKNPELLAVFYTNLGFNFEYHKHGKSPFHYSALIGTTVFEIYPFTKSQIQADKELRLGFSLTNFDFTIPQLKSKGVIFISEPMQTEFGYTTTIEDPDGRKIELYKK